MPFIGSISGAQGYGRAASVGFPVWVSSGSLGTLTDTQRAAGNTFTVSASPGPGAASVIYTVVSGSLPAGASLNSSSGLISGFSPVASNTTSSFTVRATNNAGLTADAALSISIDAVIVTWNSPAAGSLGTYSTGGAFSQTYSASATSGTVSYSVVAGSIPTGTNLNGTTGAHTGTVNSGSSQTFSYTIRATSTSASASSDRAFSVVESATLFAFTSNTFTAAGGTGTDGFGIATYRSAYAPSQPWANNGSYFFQGRFTGYQVFTVPATGTYRITATGALGGTAATGTQGYGAIVRADFTLNQGEQLEMVCGHVANTGGQNASGKSGAGGGTYVVFYNTSTPLIIAGGGCGQYSTDSPTENKNGQLRQFPSPIGVAYATSPTVSAGQGNYGWDAGGGGGLTSSGLNNPNGGTGGSTGIPNGSCHGRGFTNAGSVGGTANTGTANDFGGFGGGGGGHTGANAGGGGGGYTGGRGGGGTGSTTTTGQGGGSYIRPTGVSNVATSNGQWEGVTTFNGSPITNLGTFNSSGAGTIVIQKL